MMKRRLRGVGSWVREADEGASTQTNRPISEGALFSFTMMMLIFHSNLDAPRVRGFVGEGSRSRKVKTWIKPTGRGRPISIMKRVSLVDSIGLLALFVLLVVLVNGQQITWTECPESCENINCPSPQGCLVGIVKVN